MADCVAADRAAGGVGVVDGVPVLAAVERHLTDVVDVAAGDVHGRAVCNYTEVVRVLDLGVDSAGVTGAVVDADVAARGVHGAGDSAGRVHLCCGEIQAVPHQSGLRAGRRGRHFDRRLVASPATAVEPERACAARTTI